MSLKLKALLILVGGICAAVVGVFAVQYILLNFSFETIRNALAGIVAGVLLYTMYGVILGQLEYEQRVAEIHGKYKKTDEK